MQCLNQILDEWPIDETTENPDDNRNDYRASEERTKSKEEATNEVHLVYALAIFVDIVKHILKKCVAFSCETLFFGANLFRQLFGHEASNLFCAGIIETFFGALDCTFSTGAKVFCL